MCFLALIALTPSYAEGEAEQAERLTFSSEESQENYTVLVNELRCLVCQNQTIGDSDAGLAKDLRAKVYEMVEAGQTQDDVIDYMVQRYGDFVLYRPAFQLKTVLLWLGPIIFLILAIWLVIRWVRSQATAKESKPTMSDAQRQQVRDMLDQHKG
ncbi:cytochrome c-type biogenesis protein CcmH [Leucothrix sargassi]|nr:cytochrome c-type biogenesis protein CcmH [Leucothrix sargassi]